MSPREPRATFDVCIVGASVAAAAAARLFARAGARVALVDKRADADAYKVTCTHAILPGGAPVIERLGLAPALYARGAVRVDAEIWTPYGGWLALRGCANLGWGVTRRSFDPALRELTAATPGVEFLPGWAAAEVRGTAPPVVVLKDRTGRRQEIRSRLLVGADGRGSALARLAGVPGRVRPHRRCFYFAYWRGVQPQSSAHRVWLLDPYGGAAQFPNEDGLTMLVAGFPREMAAEVKADLEARYLRRIQEVPDAVDLSRAERVSKIMGKLDMPNVYRLSSKPGLAFVGDAAVASDPLFGVGISFALQSAEWLVQSTATALSDRTDLERGLRRYRRRLLWRLGAHHLHMASYAGGRRLGAVERQLIRRAGEDPMVARTLSQVFARERPLQTLADPRVLGRLILPRTHPWQAGRGAQPTSPPAARLPEAA